MVILKMLNPKTREVTTLTPFKLPPSHKHLADQPTAVEARNFAATYALFRVCSMRNIHMSLPPTYRDLWKGDFQELKKDDVKDERGWMYEADPFATLREREQARASMAKKREEREKRIAKETGKPGGTGLPVGHAHSQAGGKSNMMKGWERVPKIEMGRRTRTHIEDLVRRKVIWNPHQVHLSQPRQAGIVNEFSLLGFRRSHVEEAVAECKDREETLEWLLIHVPEDDLPPWSLPEGYVAGISMASGNLKREGSIKRLAAAGYATELCERTFDSSGIDESRAAGLLQDILLGDDSTLSTDVKKLNIDQVGGQDGMWEEEQTTLESIYGDRYKAIDPEVCQILLRARNSPRSLRLQARKPSSIPYPAAVPVLSVVSEPPLPAYIRLSIIRKSVEHAIKDLIGEQMIFSLVDWLESNIEDMIERPGKLKDVAAAASAVGEIHREGPRSKKPKSMPKSIDWRTSSVKAAALLDAWQARQKSPAQEKMLKVRRSLPAWNLKEAIVDSVNTHQVTIISGETGSGKSTQSVQFILDDMIQRKLGAAANIICTQPRRISALGLADRVSDERCTTVGTEIGYAIRGESKQTPGTTKITFVTTGVLLRRLQTSGGSTEDVVASLADVSHVVVDEVHERSLDTDFLLVLLRDVLKRRKDLKVILMSATLDATVFATYFGGSSVVGQIEIQGRTFPVTDYYLDDVVRLTNFEPKARSDQGRLDDADPGFEGMDFSMAKKIQSIGMGGINYDLLAQTIEAIDDDLGMEEGGILIFLPGTLEINKALEAIRHMSNLHALPLHASLLPAEQKRVFPPAPRGRRKVIAATNVAETSITIPDIVAVIDTGRVKETSFDPQNNMVRLEEVWASRAACKQRRGRAGRVAAGTCYKLYTRNVEAQKMAERPEPEIRRVPLEQLCLSVKAMGVSDVPAFLASALTPPESMGCRGCHRSSWPHGCS